MKRGLLLICLLIIFYPQNLAAQKRVQKNIDKGNYKPVIAEYKIKLEKAKKKDREGEQFVFLIILSAIEFDDNPKNPEVETHFQAALALHKKILEEEYPSDTEYWVYAWELAALSAELGKFEEARSLFADLIPAFYDKSFLKNATDSLNFLADYDEINNLFGENENTYNLINDLPQKPSALRLLMADALESDQKYIQAEKILTGDLSKLKESKTQDQELYFDYLSALTDHYLDLELISEAQVYMMEAVQYAKLNSSPKPELLKSAYRVAGNYYAELGNTEKSAFYYRKRINMESKEDIEKASLERNPYYASLLIDVAGATDSPPKTDSLLKEAESIYRLAYPSGGFDLAISLYGLALNTDNNQKCLKLYQEAAQIISSLFPNQNCYLLPRVYQGIGIVYEHLGKFDSANYSFQKSKQLSEAMGIKCNKCHGFTLVGLGDVSLNENKPSETIAFYNEALRFYQEIFGNKHSYTRLAASRKIDYQWFFKDHELARELFSQSFRESGEIIKSYFPALTEQDREKFYENLKGDYEKYPSFAIEFTPSDPSLIGSLYNHQLQTKAFLLNNFNRWKNQIINSGDIKLIKELDQWQSNKETLAKVSHLEQADANDLKINVDSLAKATDALERRLYEKAEGYSTEIDQPATWQDIRSKLKENEAAIEIVRFNVFDPRKHKLSDSVIYCALIVAPTNAKSPGWVILDHGNTLEGKYLNAYLNKVRLQVPDELSYNVFWKKINDQLKGVRRIYFSPDGVFNQININTLMNPSTGKYLSEQYNIVQVTNTKEILTIKREETFNKTGLLFGSPDFFSADPKLAESFRAKTKSVVKEGTERGIDLQDLPGTKDEVEAIEQIMKQKGWKVQIYTGKDATEDNLKSNYKPKVLHIATHGYFNLGRYSDLAIVKSGLIFSGGGKTLNSYLDFDLYKPEGEDGILTAFEAMNLNLENTDLVVLSACQSGMGDLKPGEGIYGLQRSFKMAGARSLIISLWPVDDVATKEFITQFYTSWMVAGKTKADAFKEAQAILKSKYPSPYYWGAFILVGI